MEAVKIKVDELVGKDAFVKTEQFSGKAKILCVIHGEMFPVQVELEKPDPDGHKVKRVRFNELDFEHKDSEQPTQRFIAEVVKRHHSFNIGDKYIVGTASDPPYFNVYLLNAPNKGPIGSYVHDFFEKIKPFDEPKKDITVKQPETAQIEPERVLVTNTPKQKENGGKPRKKSKKEQSTSIQMSMFDFA